MSWHPPDVDLDVVSILEDMVEVADDLGCEALSCCRSGSGASADGCLIVDENPDGVCTCIVRIRGPLPGITCCLQDADELSVVYFNMSFQVPPYLEAMVVCMNCN